MKTNRRPRGYYTYVSQEAIDSWKRVSVEMRFQWIEEMIQFQAGLPKRVRKLHEKFRLGLI